VWPRWGGTRTDTRIAYLDRTGLRVVAGDGTGDHLLDRFAGRIAPAWDPARKTVLAYFGGGAILLTKTDTGWELGGTPIRVLPSALAWSDDGRVLAVVSAKGVLFLDRSGRLTGVSALPGAPVSAAFRPDSHELAVSLRLSGRSEVRVVDADR